MSLDKEPLEQLIVVQRADSSIALDCCCERDRDAHQMISCENAIDDAEFDPDEAPGRPALFLCRSPLSRPALFQCRDDCSLASRDHPGPIDLSHGRLLGRNLVSILHLLPGKRKGLARQLDLVRDVDCQDTRAGYAIDFTTTVRELRSEPAQVIPFEPSRVPTQR